MEENKEWMEMLKQIRRNNRTQTIVCSLICIFALVVSVCCVMLIAEIYKMLPQINGIFDQMETVLVNLEQTGQQLGNVDFQGMIQDVDSLVVTGQVSLEQTMEKLNAIDFDALNKAIRDLGAVIEPLAAFFKVLY